MKWSTNEGKSRLRLPVLTWSWPKGLRWKRYRSFSIARRKGKCEQLGRPYPSKEARAPDYEKIKRIKAILEAERIQVSIGS